MFKLTMFLSGLLFVAQTLVAQPSPQEIEKMKQAIPDQLFAPAKKQHTVLVFSRTAGYRHRCIAYAKTMLKLMAQKTGLFTVVFNDRLTVFHPDSLKPFDAIVLNNPTQIELTNPQQRQALLNFVKNGGGLIGFHAATDNFYTWPEGARLLGGRFDQHPWNSKGTWHVIVEDKDHPLTQMFNGHDFDINDEIYRIRPYDLRKNAHVLLRLDSNDPRNRKAKGVRITDRDLPVSWIRTYGQGRVFYCSLGHNPHIYWNPQIVAHYLAGIQFALKDLNADATPTPLNLTQLIPNSELNALLDSMATYQYGQSRHVLMQFQELLTLILNDPVKTQQTEALILKRLTDSEFSLAAKQFLCEQLSLFASNRSLPVLQQLLIQPQTSSMALFVLQRLTKPAAVHLVLNHFEQIPEVNQPAAIALLGTHYPALSQKFLIDKLKEDQASLNEAVLNALAKIADPDVAKALFKKVQKTDWAFHSTAVNALLSVTEKLVDDPDFDSAQAVTIYNWLLEHEGPPHIRFAALKGILKANPQQGLQRIVQALQTTDEIAVQNAIQLLNQVPEHLDLTLFTEKFPALSSDNQLRLVAAIGRRNRPEVKNLLLRLIDSDSPELRLLALENLRFHQGEDLVPILSRFAAEHRGAERLKARESLYRLPGNSVDRQIVQLIPNSPTAQKIELIKACGARKITEALPVLQKELKNPNENVRISVLRALKAINQPQALEFLAPYFSNHLTPKEAQALSRTILTLLSNAPDPQVYSAAILAPAAKIQRPELREIYLEMLAKSGLPDALPLLKRTLQNESETLKAAVLRGFADWPNSAPLDLLTTFLKQQHTERLKTLALRSYLKIVAQNTQLTNQQKLTHFTFAIQQAHSPAEKRAVLASLSELPSIEAFKICQKYLQDQQVESEAAVALIKIAQKLPLAQANQALPVLKKLQAKLQNSPWQTQLETLIKKFNRWVGYITNWQVAGPYTATGKDLLDEPFPPEVQDSAVHWQTLTDNGDPQNYWHINLAQLFGGNNRVVYLKTVFRTAQNQKAIMEVGSDDYVKVWLNGQLVHTRKEQRGISPGSDKVPVTLRKGDNVILLKVVNITGGWGACLRFTDTQGNPLIP